MYIKEMDTPLLKSPGKWGQPDLAVFLGIDSWAKVSVEPKSKVHKIPKMEINIKTDEYNTGLMAWPCYSGGKYVGIDYDYNKDGKNVSCKAFGHEISKIDPSMKVSSKSESLLNTLFSSTKEATKEKKPEVKSLTLVKDKEGANASNKTNRWKFC
jgi:hypothetical protein